MKILKRLLDWFLKLFYKEYLLHVSYNTTWGDSDDKTYRVLKFYKISEKHLKFKTIARQNVEVRSSTGLNFRIEEVH